MFCWNCGHQNDTNADFCEECGSDLSQGIVEEKQEIIKQEDKAIEQAKQLPTQSQQPINFQSVSHKEPMAKKKKIGLIFGGIGIATAIGIYYYGNYYFSYDQQVARYEDTIKTKDPKKWADVLVSNDPSYQINSDNLKKMTDYYQEEDNKEEFSKLIGSLSRKRNSNSDLEVINDGKIFIFFDKYSLKINPVYLTVDTGDQTGIQVEVDGKIQGDGKDTTIKIGPLTPGIYNVKGSLKDVSSTSTVNLINSNDPNSEDNTVVTFDLHKVSFLVTSNVEGADVLVDDKKVGSIKNGSFAVKDLIWHQGMKVQTKKNFDKQEMVSDVYKIEEEEYLAEDFDNDNYYSELNLSFDDIQTKDDIAYFLDNFYYEVSNFTDDYSSYGAMEKSDFSNFFNKGEENAEYLDFNTFINGVRSSKEKSRVVGEPKVEKFSMVGKNTYQVQYLIEYRTVYDSYDKDDVVQVFRYKKGTFNYNEADEKFQIVNLGGTENFEVVDNGGVS